MESKDIIDLIPLDDETSKVANQIIKEKNIDEVQRLVHLFNLNQQKKNVIRILKLNSLLDKVSDNMLTRFEKRPDEFSNSDLLNYMNVVQSSIEKANKSLNLIDETPPIQLNQVNINVPNEVLSKESRDKVTEAVKSIMKKLKLNENEDKDPELIVEDSDQKEDNSPLKEEEDN